MVYDRIISLGQLCDTAAQIRRYTGIEHPGLFDWSNSSWTGMLSCFENNFAHFFQLPNLRPSHTDHAVIDVATGFAFAHLYGEPANRALTPGMIERDYERHRKTLSFLIRNFNDSLDSEHILLIRHGTAPDETILRLWSALERAHPAGNFDLLIVNKNAVKNKIEHPRIQVDFVLPANPGVHAWKGDDTSWDAVFARHAPANGKRRTS